MKRVLPLASPLKVMRDIWERIADAVDEWRWDRSFAKNQDALQRLGDEALAERCRAIHLPESYATTAMQRAVVEWLPTDQIYYAAIPGFQGVYGTGTTDGAARSDLEACLVEWATLRLACGMDIPSVEGQANPVHA